MAGARAWRTRAPASATPPARAFAGRGETYLAMQRYDEALADYDRAIYLGQEWAFANRALAYQLRKRHGRGRH